MPNPNDLVTSLGTTDEKVKDPGAPRKSHNRSKNSPPQKRFRRSDDDGASNESTQAMMYRTEYELQERQASLLDRFEAFMDRLERISMCLPQLQEPVQQVWMNDGSHEDDVAHEEEIILEEESYNEHYVSNLR
ncbi:hypothetical protein Y032_0113g386 [Ancylostoma ceylanicum]|uniref:Uncharacterized protein n=1 Tax=Ancylostoma ceylanicum TaxID=53326 RepID=A0A016TDM2_9BILA|nr:hypothetical protein Y032_0113g386 [Ancylostoma ceylanicum]